MRGLLFACSAVVLAAACSQKDTSPRQVGPPLTERQRDSVIGASKLPGASGVRGALRVTDSAAARRDRYDSISQNP
jgi:hypothetical protein